MSTQTQIQFKSGEFQKFIATRDFLLGDTGIKIQRGVEIEYDGLKAVYEGRGPLNIPSLRGALKLGWLVLEGSYDPEFVERPQAAGMRIRNAQGGNPMDPLARSPITTVAAEEQEVGNVRNHAQATRDLNTRRPGTRVGSAVSVDAQMGVEVRKLSTPTHSTVNLETEAGAAIRQAEAVKIKPGQGRTREELAQNLPPEERAEYLSELEARKNGYVSEEHPEAARERAANEAKLSQRTEVRRVAAAQNQQREGFNISNHVGGGVETADLGGVGGDGEVTFEEVEGMRFTNTNVTKPKPREPRAPVTNIDGSVDHRRTIAKAICPDFPDNYVFEDPARKKIARLQADYEDRPDVIRAVAAAESDDEMKRRVVEEFPGAFA